MASPVPQQLEVLKTEKRWSHGGHGSPPLPPCPLSVGRAEDGMRHLRVKGEERWVPQSSELGESPCKQLRDSRGSPPRHAASSLCTPLFKQPRDDSHCLSERAQPGCESQPSGPDPFLQQTQLSSPLLATWTSHSRSRLAPEAVTEEESPRMGTCVGFYGEKCPIHLQDCRTIKPQLGIMLSNDSLPGRSASSL